jgi:uncharacterized C2H2 Zn-finger protein
MNKIYNCTKCNYITYYSKDFNRHINSKRHAFTIYTLSEIEKENIEINIIKKEINNKNKINMCVCEKILSRRSSLVRHQNICEVYKNYLLKKNEKINEENNIKNEIEETVKDQINKGVTYDNIMETIHEMMKTQSDEIKSMLIEQTKQMINATLYTVTNNSSNNINNIYNDIKNYNNNNFSFNIFLNEHCKDALTINDFINNHLKIDPSSIEYTGRHGYIEGITKIFLDGLNQLDVYKRPIHCTDLKRETFYVKGDSKWEKDDISQTKIRQAIDTVMWKNVDQVKYWQKKHPECDIINSPEYEFHLIIMRQSLGGLKKEQNDEKIIKIIAKAVYINRRFFK